MYVTRRDAFCAAAAAITAAASPWVTAYAQSPAAPFIGVMSETLGCGGGFSADPRASGPQQPWVFLEHLDEAPKVRINGQVVELRLTASNEPKRRLKVGDRFTKVYEAPNIKVTAKLVVTQACPASDRTESCETTRMRATFEVSGGGRQESLVAYGGWGC